MDSNDMQRTEFQGANEGDKTALNIENIYRRYQQGNEVLDVLNGVNLEITPGEMVGLVGQSGSGPPQLFMLQGAVQKQRAL